LSAGWRTFDEAGNIRIAPTPLRAVK
jgi:hypothetical protein